MPSFSILGTELGLWISLDGGKRWAQYKGGEMPNVAVRDLVVHPRDSDARHRDARTRHLGRRRHLAAARADRATCSRATRCSCPRSPRYSGSSPSADGATATRHSWDRILRATRRSSTTRGSATSSAISRSRSRLRGQARRPRSRRASAADLNRVGWSMRLKAPRVPTAASAAFGANRGPRVLPGTYTVRMTKDKNVYETKLLVVPDPRSKHTRRRPQGAVRPRHEALPPARRHDLRRRPHQRACAPGSTSAPPSCGADPLADQLRRRLLADVDAIRTQDRRHQGGRNDHRRGTPARIPHRPVLQRRQLRGAPLRNPGPAHRRARPRAR